MTPVGRRTSLYAKLLGIGAVYGFGFTLVKSLFPTPVLLLLLADGPSPEGNLTVLASVYMASGLIAGLVGGPIFGLLLLGRKGPGTEVGGLSVIRTSGADLWRSLVLSFVFALLIGLISGLLTMGAYQYGILPSGGTLDPLTLIRSSNFSPGYPLLVAWTLARDLLPAMLIGLFLAPFGGGVLYRLYASRRPREDTLRNKQHFEDEF
jgi:MFS family permease